jgi:large conductance mechanosensitive channel
VKKHFSDFKDFLLKQNALALAVGVVIGAAIGKVVSAIVADIFMPIIGTLMPAGQEWRAWEIVLKDKNALKVGDLLGSLVDFFIVAIVVYLVMKTLLREKPKPVTTRPCPQCMEIIPLAARRCRACTSEVAPLAA